jgi:hypothetical protein
MTFLDFINYDIILRVLRLTLSILAGIWLHNFIQRLVIRSQCDDKGNKKEKWLNNESYRYVVFGSYSTWIMFTSYNNYT